MRLKELLVEGFIKLPPKLRDRMVNSFMTKYFAWLQDKIDELEGKEYTENKKIIDKYLLKYKINIDEEDTESIGGMNKIRLYYEIDVNELPYYDKLSKLYPDFKEMIIPKLMLVMDFKGTDVQGKYSPNLQIITLNMGPLNLANTDDLEKTLNRFLPSAIGTLEHELTHAVQYLVLRKFHSDQVGDEESVKFDGEFRDKYLNSQIEFDPFLKVLVSRFKAVDSDMKRINRTEYDPKLSLEYYVCAKDKLSDDELEKVSFMKQNEFFDALKRRDKEKWKKAVKLFYQGINA